MDVPTTSNNELDEYLRELGVNNPDGALAQGISLILTEAVLYDENSQPIPTNSYNEAGPVLQQSIDGHIDPNLPMNTTHQNNPVIPTITVISPTPSVTDSRQSTPSENTVSEEMPAPASKTDEELKMESNTIREKYHRFVNKTLKAISDKHEALLYAVGEHASYIAREKREYITLIASVEEFLDDAEAYYRSFDNPLVLQAGLASNHDMVVYRVRLEEQLQLLKNYNKREKRRQKEEMDFFRERIAPFMLFIENPSTEEALQQDDPEKVKVALQQARELGAGF